MVKQIFFSELFFAQILSNALFIYYKNYFQIFKNGNIENLHMH